EGGSIGVGDPRGGQEPCGGGEQIDYPTVVPDFPPKDEERTTGSGTRATRQETADRFAVRRVERERLDGGSVPFACHRGSRHLAGGHSLRGERADEPVPRAEFSFNRTLRRENNVRKPPS